MKRSPSFSIIMPTFQRRDIVCDAVRALCRLDYPGEVEVIVAVDGSTDGSAAALREICCPFPFQVIEQENAGAATARNRGVDAATGEILLFLDDDMMAVPNLLTEHARGYEHGADAVLGHIPLDPASPEGLLSEGVRNWTDDRLERLRTSKKIDVFDLLTGQLSVKRSIFLELGGFDQGFTASGSFGNEDLDFGLRLIEGYRVEFAPEAISHQLYAVSPQSYLRQWTDTGRADVALARKHPLRARELFDQRGASAVSHRFLFKPLSAIPGFSALLSLLTLAVAGDHAKVARPLRRPIAFLLYAARSTAYWSAVRDAGGVPASRRLLTLCYHAIADLSGDAVLADYGISRETFAAQIDSLIARGFVFVGPDELLALLQDRGRLPKNAVLLTFDDCYEELADVSRSILKPRGIPAIAFAVSAMPSGTNEWDQAIGARRLALLGGAGLQLLRACGVEVGCHSRSHRHMSALGDTELARETIGAAEELEKAGLPRPRFFAYPYGQHDERVCAATRAAGFEAAFALLPGRVTPRSQNYALPRTEILAGDAGWRFRLKTRFPHLSRALRTPAALRRLAARIGRAGVRLRPSRL